MNEKGFPEFATVLAFDVRLDAEAALLAEELHVRVMSADIIYHLFDQFKAFMDGIIRVRKEAAMAVAVYPCVCKMMGARFVFNKKDPIVLGVEVADGVLKLGTMLTIPAIGFFDVGKVVGIELDRKEVNQAKKGQKVSIKLSNESNPTVTYGRQFDDKSGDMYSKISRASIDALKEHFRSDVPVDDFKLVAKMKTTFNIP